MASWVVLEPPVDAKSGDPVFVRDDFRWWGLVVPPAWLAWHRLWLEALVVLAALVGINALVASGLVAPVISWLSPLVGLFVALEGPAMRIASLRRRGYTEAAAISADDIEEADLRYGEGLDEGDDEIAAWSPTPAPVASAPRPHGPALGLLSYPGRS